MLKQFAVAVFLAAAGLAAAPILAADLPTHPFIHVTASAEFYVMPDLGEIDIDIVSLEPNPDAAWKEVNDGLEAVRALMVQHGVAPDDVLVQDIVRRPRKVEVLPEGQPVPMDTRVAIHMTVRDLAQWTPLLRSLLVMKNIESLAVTFNRSDRARIEDDLLAEALAKAKLKAQNIAQGVGAKLGPATGVSIAPLRNLSNAMGMASDPYARNIGERRAAAKGSEMALVAAMRLAQQADVIYRIGAAGARQGPAVGK